MSSDMHRPRGGILWSAINGGAAVAIPFAVFALFTRIMLPAEIALVMLAIAMLELLKACGPQGFYDVVQRHDEAEQAVYRSAGMIFLGAGVLLSLIYVALVLLSSWFLYSPLPPILLILVVKILADFATLQPQAMLARRMEVRRLGQRSLIAGIAAGAFGLTVAMLGAPVFGLACYYVVQSVILFVATVAGTRSWLMPRWHGVVARTLLTQGVLASSVRFTAGISNYLDQLVVGATLLPQLAGQYNLGKRVEVVSITIGGSFAQMLFQPQFARAQAEHRPMLIGRAVAILSLTCGVPVTILAVYHGSAIPLIFGQQWASASLVVAVLAANGFARAVGGVAGSLLAVTHRNGRMLQLSAVAAATNILVLMFFVQFGLVAAAAALLVRNTIQTIVALALTGDARGKLMRILVTHCAIPLMLAGNVAWVVGQVVQRAVPGAGLFPQLILLLAASAAGALAAFLALRRKV